MSKKLKDPDYFIVGLQKSGTWWLTALLDAHPEIRCLPNHVNNNASKGKTGADEGRIFDMLAAAEVDGGKALRFSFNNYHGGFFKGIVPMIGRVSREQLHKEVKKRYREWFQFQNKEEKPIVGDKTVEYIFHLDLLDSFYPKAKKICILRDPTDRVVSWHYHQLRQGRKKTTGISDLFLRQYVRDQIVKEYEHMLDYDEDIHCLTYEALSQQPHKVLGKVLSYLGARSDSKTLENMIDAASIEKLRAKDTAIGGGRDKKRGTTIVGSHYRKGVTGDGKLKLSEGQLSIVKKELGNLEKRVCEKYNIIL